MSELLAFILGAIQPVWSDRGMVAAAQWKAFARYVTQAARGRESLPDRDALERFLPYAAAFALAASLLKRQEKQYGVTLPPWFQAIGGEDGSKV